MLNIIFFDECNQFEQMLNEVGNKINEVLMRKRAAPVLWPPFSILMSQIYSYFKASMGLPSATLMAWKLMASQPIARAIMVALTKVMGLMLM